jgi:GT2 family glycosyltransferase
MNEVLMQCMASLFAVSHGVAFEAIVVDNESDGSLRVELSAAYPDVVLITETENTGFARACNRGTAVARGVYVLYLNPDTELPAGTLARMVEFVESAPDAGIVGPLTRNVDGSVEPSIYRFPSAGRTFNNVFYLQSVLPWLKGYECGHSPESGGPRRVEVICGACLMTRRELIDRLGGFDNDFWMYGEDVEMCYRYARHGFISYFLPDCTVIHKRGGKHLADDSVVDIARVAYWHYQWIFLFHEKHSSAFVRAVIRRLLYVSIVFKYKPRKKKLDAGRNLSKHNRERVAAFERLLAEHYGR